MGEKEPFSRVYEQVLPHLLAEVAHMGWQDAALTKACEAAGVSQDECLIAFADGIKTALGVFFAAQDEAMCAALAAYDDKKEDMKIRERITQALYVRLDVDMPHKEAIRAALGALALPQNAPLALKLSFASANKIWRWAGDSATDYNYYTKRLILASVTASSTLFWLSDESDGAEETRAFIARRIEDVMRFEKAKASLRKKFSASPAA